MTTDAVADHLLDRMAELGVDRHPGGPRPGLITRWDRTALPALFGGGRAVRVETAAALHGRELNCGGTR